MGWLREPTQKKWDPTRRAENSCSEVRESKHKIENFAYSTLVTPGAHHDTVSKDIFPISLLCLPLSSHCATPRQMLPPPSHWAKHCRSCQLHLPEWCLDPKRPAAAQSYLEGIVAPPLPSSGVPHRCRPSPTILWFDRHPHEVPAGATQARQRVAARVLLQNSDDGGVAWAPPRSSKAARPGRDREVDLRSDGST
jgi:hypothetical protein